MLKKGYQALGRSLFFVKNIPEAIKKAIKVIKGLLEHMKKDQIWSISDPDFTPPLGSRVFLAGCFSRETPSGDSKKGGPGKWTFSTPFRPPKSTKKWRF